MKCCPAEGRQLSPGGESDYGWDWSWDELNDVQVQ